MPKEKQAPEFRLKSRVLELPLHEVKGYPFVEMTVGGRQAKFMVDTGAETALALNTRRFPLRDARVVSRGHFGSGQSFDVLHVPVVEDIRLGPIQLREVHDVQAQDASQLERITPDFGGWIGYHFWGEGALKLSYASHRVTFYPRADAGKAIDGENVVCAIHFRTRKLVNHPIVSLRLGSQDVVVSFDSGQYGAIFASDDVAKRLVGEGVLAPSAKDTYDLKRLDLGCGANLHVDGLPLVTRPFPAAEDIGMTEPNVMTLGYGLFKQYDSVWDFTSHTLYLLAPKPHA
ncbi:hypothetical protein L2Y94_00960 [Luteibacter aegosomatis]|uniref:hypothetical protein n=1 Tax=Luteibacter aegosomatis TaxID=2911537 RepID=UPI001FFA19A3|nr:hypothetical protein [Luteibacter aegosomatis]UPG85966.1 hypothetical protein L2Y94_00960 [Luteibacter aegosomatis]